MNLITTLKERFASRQTAEQAAKTSMRQRWTDALVAAADGKPLKPERVESLLSELGLSIADFEADLQRLIDRRALAREAAQSEAATTAADDAGDALAQLEAAHRAAVDAHATRKAVLIDQLSQAQRAAERARTSHAEISRTSPQRPKIEAQKAKIAELRGPALSAERIASLLTTAGIEDQRALELARSPDHAAQPLASAARQRAKDARAEATRIEKMLADIEKQEATLQHELAALEAAAIQSAIAGELPAPPAAQPAEKPRGRQMLHLGGV